MMRLIGWASSDEHIIEVVYHADEIMATQISKCKKLGKQEHELAHKDTRIYER